MNKALAILACAALVRCLQVSACLAATPDLKPLISERGRELVSEDFSGTALPAKWRPGGRPMSFSVVDGALQGICAADDSHGPAISVPVEARNFTVQFSIKFTKPGNALLLVDGDNAFGEQDHLLRVALGAKSVALQQDSGSLESKKANKAARDAATKAGRKAPAPTPEDLANPKFHRTDTLVRKPAKLDDGQWHHVLVEVNGQEAVAQVGEVVLRATGSVLDAKKHQLVFLIGGAGTMLIDNVKVWENAPRRSP